jgi:hypothetical protein
MHHQVLFFYRYTIACILAKNAPGQRCSPRHISGSGATGESRPILDRPPSEDVLHGMKSDGIAITCENYIACNWGRHYCESVDRKPWHQSALCVKPNDLRRLILTRLRFEGTRTRITR